MKYFPILLITYNRPDHTRRTLEALQQNIGASESDLYVYVDGPKDGATQEQIERIEEVKRIALSRQWCKRVMLRTSEKNRGCRDAVIYAITDMLQSCEALIILEDDIITSPAFLTYMNNALVYYKDRKTVFSISGHSHSPQKFQIPTDYPYDVFVSPRLFNWGWGTWADRWAMADWSMDYYPVIKNNVFMQQAFNRTGDDMMLMLTDEYEGRSSAWDIQFTFMHFANHAVSIVPCISYTYNIGMDGSGTHCNAVRINCDSYIVNTNNNPRFIDILYLDSRICNRQYSAFCRKKRPIWKKMINWISRRIGIRPPFMVKKKVYQM